MQTKNYKENKMNNRNNVPIPGHKPPVPVSYPLVDENMMNFIREHEGVVNFLYKDSIGKITAGAGFNIDKQPKKAFEFGFRWGDSKGVPSGNRVLLKDIERAYQKIEKMPMGRSADFYDPLRKGNEDLLNIRLPEPGMDQILRQKLTQSERELRQKIPNFDSIPYPARKALLDMQYNIGDTKFRESYWDAAQGKNIKAWYNLYKAIDAKDWKRAAQESRRRGVSEERNKRTYNLIIEGNYW